MRLVNRTKRRALNMFFPPAFFTLVVANILIWLAAIYFPASGMQKGYSEIQTTSLALLSEKNDYRQNLAPLFSASGLDAELSSHNQTANFSFTINFTGNLFSELAQNFGYYEEFTGNSSFSHPFCAAMKNDFSNLSCKPTPFPQLIHI